MAQLSLFEGSHLPYTAAREALSRGRIEEAHAQLARASGATPEAADATRLEQIAARLPAGSQTSVDSVHEAFLAALAAVEPRGLLSNAEWFSLYARRVAAALDAEPGPPFRGWLGAHFALVGGEAEEARSSARRIIESLPPGPAWTEAARIAFELGDAVTAREWIHAACLDSAIEFSPEPPALEHCGVPALDSPRSLPRLPASVENLFDVALALEDLPGPRMGWVVGEVDRVLGPAKASEQEPTEGGADEGDAARAFLAALRAARRSRERDGARRPDRCSDRELRARRRMQRLAPALLERYLRGLREALL